MQLFEWLWNDWYNKNNFYVLFTNEMLHKEWSFNDNRSHFMTHSRIFEEVKMRWVVIALSIQNRVVTQYCEKLARSFSMAAAHTYSPFVWTNIRYLQLHFHSTDYAIKILDAGRAYDNTFDIYVSVCMNSSWQCCFDAHAEENAWWHGEKGLDKKRMKKKDKGL